MRYQGRIADWKDERGFGFIAPNGGGAKIFLHVSALRSGEPRPRGNELVTYDLAAADGKGSRAHDVAYVECVRTISSAHRDAHTLAGSLGIFGFSEASHLAQQIESQFKQFQQQSEQQLEQQLEQLAPEEIYLLQTLLDRLRAEISL